MPYNGSGTFSRPVADYVPNTAISSTKVNSEMDGIATGLTTALTKDGQTTPTANLPMGTYRHTGVGNASARTDYAAAGQVQDGSLIWAGTAGGTADALTLTLTPAITAYATGQEFLFQAGASPNTGAATVAINGLAAKAIEMDDAALTGGEIEANKYYSILYDGTAFQLSRLSTPVVDTTLFLPKSGGTMTGAIAMGGNAISGAEGVKDIGGAWNAIGSTASAVTLDYTAYNGASFEPTGNLTVSVTNLPAGYSDGGFIITGGGDHTLTFSGFDATTVAALPTLQTTTGVDHLFWWSPDGGSNIYIKAVATS